MGTVSLTDADRAQLSARADQFHAALSRGAAGDWDTYLAGLPEHVRPAVLAELVIIDLGHRWARGERPRVEDYLQRFPELGPADRVPAAVVLEEHRCRMKAGERSDPQSFRARFPDQYPQIREEVESGRAGTVARNQGSTLTSEKGEAARNRTTAVCAQDYDFLRILGRGVFGEVWLARKRTSGIEKAVKILVQAVDHEAADRERRSLELIKNLRHPYLLATEDFWVADNRIHVSMELADGSLRDELKRCREAGLPGIPPDRLLGYVWEAAEGLDFLHSRRVVHRDVKPDNILLLHGHAKVADFGLARYQEEVLAPMRTFAGTPAYMAPEVWGKSSGPPSDQYSLAVAYAELRQGTPPVRPRPIHDMLVAHAEGAFEFSELIGPEERAVVLKALAREPENRYPTCRAFVEALAAELKHVGVPRPVEGFGTVVTSAGTLPDAHNPTRLNAPSHAQTVGGALATAAAPVAAAVKPPPRPVWLLVAAGVLAVGLATALGVGLWDAFGKGRGPDTGTTQQPEPQPEPNAPQVPKDWSPVPDAELETLADGRKLYRRIQRTVNKHTVLCRLITAESGPPVEPFYIMESKVWNGLRPESTGPDPDLPLTGLTWYGALEFAASLGGRVPTPDEWDHAAGLFSAKKDRTSVTRSGGRPHVNAARPALTYRPPAERDVNDFGLLDMAGNGREWTGGMITPPDVRPFAVLRGNCFSFKDGLTFEELSRQRDDQPHTQVLRMGSPYTSFRVVVPVP